VICQNSSDYSLLALDHSARGPDLPGDAIGFGDTPADLGMIGERLCGSDVHSGILEPRRTGPA